MKRTLSCSKKDSDEWIDYFEDENNIDIGFKKVKSAKIGMLKKLSKEEILYNTSLAQFKEKYDSIQGYIAGIYFDVDGGDNYISDGLNLNMIITGLQDGRRRVIEYSVASPWLIDKKFTEEETNCNLGIQDYINQRGLSIPNNS